MTAIAARLPDGRLHLQHGPIDCLCQAWGDPTEVTTAYTQAAARFANVLTELCNELPSLRTALPTHAPSGLIARTMHAACMPFAGQFITPMAAVAGAVADSVLAAMVAGRTLTRAFVNNGGDIAFHLTPGESLRCGLITDLTAHIRTTLIASTHASTNLPKRATTKPDNPIMPAQDPRERCPGTPAAHNPVLPDATFLLTAHHPARGLATSGRACKGHGGRSFSFGIADTVSVLARTAAQADAAATIIGNAVDLPNHPAIDRRPAADIDPATDLGNQLITFDVGRLPESAVKAALDAGETMADTLRHNGLIEAAVLTLQSRLRISQRQEFT